MRVTTIYVVKGHCSLEFEDGEGHSVKFTARTLLDAVTRARATGPPFAAALDDFGDTLLDRR